MKRLFVLLTAIVVLSMAVSAQINEIKRIPSQGSNDFSTSVYDRSAGFWAAVESMAGYSLQSRNNAGFGEVDAIFGYRFNEYFRVGPGLGVRYYFPAGHLRVRSFQWAFPIYLNMRGNLECARYRDVVPYYSLDIGGTIQDGFMWRPSIGIRVGSPRKAFIAALSYMGQEIRDYKFNIASPGERKNSSKYVSFVALRLGYEF